MAERTDAAEAFALHAVVILRRARVDLDRLDRVGAGNRIRRHVVVSASERLATLAREAVCPGPVAVLLQDWRDRLGSHVLVAEALAELEVHPDLADQLLVRGVDELLDEAPGRLDALRVGDRLVVHD